jgi:hypothetical protein
MHPSFPGVFEEFSELKQVARIRLLKPLYGIYRIEPDTPAGFFECQRLQATASM